MFGHLKSASALGNYQDRVWMPVALLQILLTDSRVVTNHHTQHLRRASATFLLLHSYIYMCVNYPPPHSKLLLIYFKVRSSSPKTVFHHKRLNFDISTPIFKMPIRNKVSTDNWFTEEKMGPGDIMFADDLEGCTVVAGKTINWFPFSLQTHS